MDSNGNPDHKTRIIEEQKREAKSRKVQMKEPTVCDCECAWTCIRCRQPHCPACDCECAKQIRDEDYCDDCAKEVIEEHEDEITGYVAQLMITGDVEVYDAASRFAPSPSDYEAGLREAYTANSVGAGNRHNRTNYDKLVAPLDRDDALDCAIYHALRERVEELLEEAEQDAEFKDVEEEEADEDRSGLTTTARE